MLWDLGRIITPSEKTALIQLTLGRSRQFGHEKDLVRNHVSRQAGAQRFPPFNGKDRTIKAWDQTP